MFDLNQAGWFFSRLGIVFERAGLLRAQRCMATMTIRACWILAVFGLLAGCSASSEMADMEVGTSTTADYGSAAKDEVSMLASRSPGSTGEAAMSVLLKNRHVIRTAELEVKVADVEAAEKAAQTVISKADGFVAQSSSDGLGGESPRVLMTVRVPVASFEGTLSALAGLGVLQSKSLGSDDVTAQVVDLDARLKTLRAKEEAYVGMLKKLSSTADVVSMQDTLSNVRTEIESIMGQRQQLAAQAQFSTITLTLVQGASTEVLEKDRDWSTMAWADAGSAFGGMVRGVGTVGIWFLTFAPIWLPMALLFGAGIWWLRRSSTPSA